MKRRGFIQAIAGLVGVTLAAKAVPVQQAATITTHYSGYLDVRDYARWTRVLEPAEREVLMTSGATTTDQLVVVGNEMRWVCRTDPLWQNIDTYYGALQDTERSAT